MTDISDLAGLNFEDLAQADLFDLVRRGGAGSPGSPHSEVEESSRSSSPSCLDAQESYTHITLINGERICLKEELKGDQSNLIDDCPDNEELNIGNLDFDIYIIRTSGFATTQKFSDMR